MTEDIPAWAKDFKPRQNAPKPSEPAQNGHKPLSKAELDSLATLPPEELISLIKRICGAAGWLRLATLTEEELKAATRLRLAELALNCKDDKLALQAISQLLDRLEGKPAQTLDMNIEDKRLEKLPTDRLLRLENELARLTGCEALVIPPQPKRLEDQ